jgi:hypothetical protein
MATDGQLASPTLVLAEPMLVFASASDDRSLELRVNFGLFAGRESTPAEIEQLAQHLLPKIDRVTIVSELRYEIGTGAGCEPPQVRPAEHIGGYAGRGEQRHGDGDFRGDQHSAEPLPAPAAPDPDDESASRKQRRAKRNVSRPAVPKAMLNSQK